MNNIIQFPASKMRYPNGNPIAAERLREALSMLQEDDDQEDKDARLEELEQRIDILEEKLYAGGGAS